MGFWDDMPRAGEELATWLHSTALTTLFRERSGASILAEIRSRGGSIGNEEFGRIRREILGTENFFSQLRRLGEDSIAPRSWMIFDHGQQLSRNFKYSFLVGVVNPNTNERRMLNYSFSSSSEVTVGTLVREIKRTLEVGTNETPWIVEWTEFRSVLARPGVFEKQ